MSTKLLGQKGFLLLQAEVLEHDIKLQGIGLKELLEKYFVAPELGLLEQEYWANYTGFKMILNVSGPVKKACCIQLS